MSLSDEKIYILTQEFYPAESVKQFIKGDWKLMTDYIEGKINLSELIIQRGNLVGEGLI